MFRVLSILLLLVCTPALAEPAANSAVLVATSSGHGSGVYLGHNLVLTAGHVAKNAVDGQMQVKWPRSPDWTDNWSATVVWIDEAQDFALLKINSVMDETLPKSTLTCVEPTIGQDVTVVGWPLDLGKITARGYVAGADDKRSIWPHSFILIAPIAPGNSGGPVYDADGKVIALVVGLVQGTSLSIIIPVSRVCDRLPSGYDK